MFPSLGLDRSPLGGDLTEIAPRPPQCSHTLLHEISLSCFLLLSWPPTDLSQGQRVRHGPSDLGCKKGTPLKGLSMHSMRSGKEEGDDGVRGMTPWALSMSARFCGVQGMQILCFSLSACDG